LLKDAKKVYNKMMNRWMRLCLCLLFISYPRLIPLGAASNPYAYQVVFILDGDTFIATDGNVKFRVRIVAMDAPEKGQPYADAAKGRLQQLLQGKAIQIQPVGKGYDLYGRVLGQVWVEGQDAARLLIEDGLATYYRPTCQDYPADKRKYNYDPGEYIKAEEKARLEKKGMWSLAKLTFPCRFRHSEAGKKGKPAAEPTEESEWKLWKFSVPKVLF